MISILLQIEYFKTVSNKTEERISKRVFQENKACPIFRKRNIFYPLIRTRTYIRTYVRTHTYVHTHTYVCVSGSKKCSFFGKFDVLLFS